MAYAMSEVDERRCCPSVCRDPQEVAGWGDRLGSAQNLFEAHEAVR
jgi:hypothetical protein